MQAFSAVRKLSCYGGELERTPPLPALHCNPMTRGLGFSGCRFSLEGAIEIVVRTDPEPFDGIPFANADRAVLNANANGPNVRRPFQFLESQCRMAGILKKQAMRFASLLTDMMRQLMIQSPKRGGALVRSQIPFERFGGPFG